MIFIYLHPLYRSGFIKMLKHIHIKEPWRVYMNYIISPISAMTLIDQRNMILPIDNTKISSKKIKYKFDNKTFIIYESKSDNNGYVLSMRKNKDTKTCLHIITCPTDNVAIINSINYNEECIIIGLEYNENNDILFKMCIKYMKKNKDKYKINRLLLNDNSFYRSNNNNIIEISLLHTLLFGNTWYGKYGFRPYKYDEHSSDKYLNDLYNDNYNIATTTKIKDTKLFTYFFEIYKDIMPEKIEEYQKKYNNLTINKFFQIMLIILTNSDAFISICISFYNSTKLYDFRGYPFFLDI